MLVAICKALNIDTFEHHRAVGINKAAIKGKIKALKLKRDELAAAKKRKEHKDVLERIHRLKRKLHKAMV